MSTNTALAICLEYFLVGHDRQESDSVQPWGLWEGRARRDALPGETATQQRGVVPATGGATLAALFLSLTHTHTRARGAIHKGEHVT